ncbi:MAG: hypothetical protein JRG68_05745 [Deltaproteobacteria bacterium]|nr:hypothetical protein [Deltaproteobacteria bacterium]MBW2100252.1 hypothetical protein [Deltaproteobacteria bacterium]
MEINTVAMQQSHIVKELNTSGLDKNLNQTDEHSKIMQNQEDKDGISAINPNLGQNINLFA